MFAPLRAITSGDVRKVSSVDQAVNDLVEGVSIWGVPGLEVDSFVHEVHTFDRHLPAWGKVDQAEAIFICTLMQAVLAYRWLMFSRPTFSFASPITYYTS
jgi:hypothetical protein